ncbi:amino acid permease [Brevibacterium sp. 'Marine']|uniref:APC family permease n=1 Tax=Brevibacterium sp. 'Marine' TaxID=2725563 RepID=UPI00145E7F33|nr:amino acid permease [Brevibacterium sp. 'Marine']
MPQHTTDHRTDGQGQLKRALGVPSLVFFGLVYMVPLTVFTTYGIVTQVTGGRVPLAYVITLLAMVFTARSYAKMAAELPFAGSAYTYTQKSFGAGIGFVAGWALLLDYLFLPMINYLVIGIYLSAAFPMIPAWIFVVTAIALVTVLNIIGIVSVARANVVIIAAQTIFIFTFAGLGIASMTGTGTVDLAAPFTGDGTADGFGNVMAGAAILCLSFLGFDAVSTLSEEAKDAKRTVPRAIIIATVTGGLIYIALSFLAQLAYPSNDFTDVDSGALDVMAAAGGQFLTIFFTAAYVAGACGSALTSQASVSRILYAMGRDGVLPKSFFGRLSPRFHTPVLATLAVGLVSLLALAVDLGFISEMVSFGALIAFSAVNLSVIKHFVIDGKRRGGAAVFSFIVLPGIGFCLTLWLWTSLSPRTLLIGAIWLLIGIAYLAVVTRGFRRSTPMLDLTE